VDAVRPKSVNTISHVEQIVRAYLIPRFGNEIAKDIKSLDIQQWLKSLHDSNSLAWTTISKMRGVMRRIYKIGILHEHVAKNPVLHVETRSKTDYKPIVIIPSQTLAILSNWLVNKANVEPKTVQESCVTARFRRHSICTRRKTATKHWRRRGSI